jgi:hypothetical protein
MANLKLPTVNSATELSTSSLATSAKTRPVKESVNLRVIGTSRCSSVGNLPASTKAQVTRSGVEEGAADRLPIEIGGAVGAESTQVFPLKPRLFATVVFTM